LPSHSLDEPWLGYLVAVADLGTVMGGSVAAIFAVGYAGRGLGVWGPDALIAVGLLGVDGSLRRWRAARRRARWRRLHPDDVDVPKGPFGHETGFPRADVNDDFQRARRTHTRRWLTSRLLRTNAGLELVRLDEVVHRAACRERELGLQTIRLVSIVGTVDKRLGFDRRFSPTSNLVRERWTQLALAQRRGVTMPPIEVYRVADRHFVSDGHHRVSIATVTGQTRIDAYVTEIINIPTPGA
jgi:hypothetical protein